MRLMKIQEVAAALAVSVRTVWRMKDSGAMPAPVRVGSAVRWREGDLTEWIEAGCPDCRKVWRPAAASGRG